MPSAVDFGTRTTMPEGGCIDLWRRYLLGNLSWGFVWFVPAFWIMELLFCCVALVSVISPWARASLRSLCNKTGITISPSWLENSQGFDKYSRYFLLNHFKQKQRSKEKKKMTFLQLLPNETTARQEPRSSCSQISLSALQHATHQPHYSNYTNSTVTPSQKSYSRFGTLLFGMLLEIDPQICCCLMTQPAHQTVQPST